MSQNDKVVNPGTIIPFIRPASYERDVGNDGAWTDGGGHLLDVGTYIPLPKDKKTSGNS